MEQKLQKTNNSRHILLVEDDKVLATHLQKLLGIEGLIVCVSKNGIEAKKYLESNAPDLIILDIILPDMDGYELCHWIREQNRLRLTPIIFLSAKDEIDDKVFGLQSGADDYVTKPFSFEELLARINVILERMKVFHELSMRDELTGAYNRRYFNEHLAQEVHRVKRYGHQLAVAMVDIDNFKLVNDTYGHQAGDFVLIEVVKFLQNNLRKSDLVARFGGEEFIILLSETGAESAEKLLKRIQCSLQAVDFNYRSSSSEDLTIKVTISIGMAHCPNDSVNQEELIFLADQALYRAKNQGRNCIVISDRLKKPV